MCYAYYERLQREEDLRRELLELQEPPADKDLERTLRERPVRTAPEEPARAREKVPA